MQITRFIHSCVVVQDGDKAVLIDPGYFSWESGLIDIAKLPDLSEIAITHEHSDHFHLPFVEALRERFPELVIVTTAPVQQQLAAADIIDGVTTESTELITVFAAGHEALPKGMGELPENIGVHVLGTVTHPGDSHHFSECKKVLALPITAPWGSVTNAMDLALQLHPEIILPVHDWHWHDAARKTMYERLADYCKTQNILFIEPSDGEPTEV